MANPSFFQSRRYREPARLVSNEAGGSAYEKDPHVALVQYALTGCLTNTYYASAETQFDTFIDLINHVGDPDFVAKTAIYARQQGGMKDAPVLLLASLVSKNLISWESQERAQYAFRAAFGRVIDNGRQLRTFVQMLRSGKLGRRSLGSLPRKMITWWINDHASEWQLWLASVGGEKDIALRDILRLVRPKPHDKQREALYNWLVDKPLSDTRHALLPADIQSYLHYENSANDTIPNAPFEMLVGLPKLTSDQWKQIAQKATWQQTRMNLNTFQRHGVFDDPLMVQYVADKLRNPVLIERAKVLPYQLLAATVMTQTLPYAIRQALSDTVMLATKNVPALHGEVVICPDLSGSMNAPVTGQRSTSNTTTVQCRDAAALITYAILQRNPGSVTLPFHNDVALLPITQQTSLVELTKLFHSTSGGTNISAPLSFINRGGVIFENGKHAPDVVIIVSDNESWLDASYGEQTATMREWNQIHTRNPEAKLVLFDLAAYRTSQGYEREDILQCAGFGDAAWEVVARFCRDETHNRLIDAVNAVLL